MTIKNAPISQFKSLAATAAILLTVGLSPMIVQAQITEPWTGSIVGSTIELGNASTLISIRNMLNKGQAEAAVRESKKFIERLSQDSRSGRTSTYTYEAYNALCISLTSTGAFDEAMKACNTAIDMEKRKWQAINSRGSLHYKSGKYQEALADYRLAFELAPKLDRYYRVIEHNIKIAEGKVNSG